MIRSLRASDIPALILFTARLPANEARTRDQVGPGEGGQLFAPVLKGWLSLEKRRSLVYVRRGLIRGLVCCRSPRRASTWEIDRLFLINSDQGVCLDLLERISLVGGEQGVDRVFLRLPAASPLVDIAQRAGFTCYLTESLYRLQGRGTQPTSPALALRRRSGADEYGLFRLYTAAVPPQVRSAQGLTVEEWRQGRDQGAQRELVYEQEGQLSAWLRVSVNGRAGQFDIMSTLDEASLYLLAGHGVQLLAAKRPIFCLVPDFQHQLKRCLEEQGFDLVMRYSCLVRQLAVRGYEFQLVPQRA